MGEIIKKKKGKVKNFFNQGKKLVQTPKELPEINVQPKTKTFQTFDKYQAKDSLPNQPRQEPQQTTLQKKQQKE